MKSEKSLTKYEFLVCHVIPSLGFLFNISKLLQLKVYYRIFVHKYPKKASKLHKLNDFIEIKSMAERAIEEAKLEIQHLEDLIYLMEGVTETGQEVIKGLQKEMNDSLICP